MRIYYICAADITNYDAQRTHVLEVAGEMHAAGEVITLFLPQFRDARESFAFPARYIPVILKNSKLKFVEYEIRLLFVLLFACLRRRPQILYTRKGFLTLVPGVISRLLRIPSIIEVNGIIADEVKAGFGLPEGAVRLFALFEKWSYRLSHRVVTVTEGLKTILQSRYRIPAERIVTIANGVNVTRFAPRQIQENGEKIYLGFVGHLVPWAGVEYLIRALAAVRTHRPEVHGLIVGEGQLRPSLEALAQSLKLGEALTFTGKVSPEEVPHYINRCAICFVPAVRERNAQIGGSSLKLYEYMACGKPVIVSDIPGLDIVAQYEAGLIVEAENVAALEEAVLYLLENPELCKQMEENARETARKHFSWRHTTERILALCRTLNCTQIPQI